MRGLTALGLIVLNTLAGCGGVDGAKLARAGRPTPAPLGMLQGRGYSIEIYAGPVFTVLSDQGEVLAELVSSEQLQAEHPDLYKKIEYIYAANIAGSVLIETRSVRTLEAVFSD